ncbi:DUF5719 family protein [Actinomycetaceae bacterium L2_0104]
MRIRRVVSSLSVLALGGASVAAAVVALPREPQFIETPLMSSSSSIPSAVCTGGFERTFEKGLDANRVDEDITSEALAMVSGSEAQLTHDTETESLEREGDISFLRREGSLEGTLQPQNVPADSTHLAGASIHVADEGDTRGSATNPCTVRSVDQWIVGSASAVGTTNQLVLSNPGHTPVTVRIEAFGSAGPLDMGSAGTVVVAATSTQRVDLDGLIPADPRIALHITTDSGAVAASLQVNELDGVKPQGVSFVTGASAGTDLVIPAVSIPEGEEAIPSVRLVNTDTERALISVELVGADGTEPLPGGSEVAVAPGAVLDLSLTGVEPGSYALRIHSYQQFTAGVLLVSETSDSGARDMAWASAEPAVSSGTAMFGESAADLVVSNQNEEAADAEVTPINGDGTAADPTTLEIESASSATLELPEDSVGVLVDASQPVSAAVLARPSLSDGDGIDWVPLFAPALDEGARRVAVAD